MSTKVKIGEVRQGPNTQAHWKVIAIEGGWVKVQAIVQGRVDPYYGTRVNVGDIQKFAIERSWLLWKLISKGDGKTEPKSKFAKFMRQIESEAA